MSTKRKPVALLILDGFGYREDSDANAIANANTPVWDRLWKNQPHALVSTSGMAVGLPEGQMGNSEVGHMNLGAGRIVYQNFTRITQDITDGAFFHNSSLTKAVDSAIDQNKAVHIIGLLSPGGVHSHEDHIHAMVRLAAQRGAKAIYLHAILDGRDMPPKSAEASLQKTQELFDTLGVGQIASVIGRYFAMDRDKRWDRVEKAYHLFTLGEAERQASSALTALAEAYQLGETDEFVKATRVGSEAIAMADGDAVICMNFRADRAREITQAFIEPAFDGFQRRATPALVDYVMLTEYADYLNTSCAYPPELLSNSLGEYVSQLGKTQLRIAETEKYAHVTFFFSGGREQAYDGETRILIESPKVDTYDLKPEMSAVEVTDKLVAAIESGDFDLLVCNYANGDMVGHTGIYDAAVRAVETLDECLGRVTSAIENAGGHCLITADHGNCEQMTDAKSHQPHTAHTCYPVPLVYVGSGSVSLSDGRLCDIAPTLLSLMQLPQPEEMTGESLVEPASQAQLG